METVKNATEVFNMVMAELKALKASPDLDPLQSGRVFAQLCGVAMQAIALCETNWKAINDWDMRQRP